MINLDSVLKKRAITLPKKVCIVKAMVALVVKNLIANEGDLRDMGSFPWSGRLPEEGLVTHFSNFSWRIPWTGEPGGL